MLLSLCSVSRPLPGPTVSLAVSPTQSWEPRGVLRGIGTIRARRASRRGVATERQKKRLSSHMTCPNCGVSCSAGRRKCTTPKPKTLQDGESAGVGTCGLARDQNVRTRATLRAEKLATGVQLTGGWSARLLRGRGSKLVVMATGRRLLRKSSRRRLSVFLWPRCKRQATTSATAQDAPVAMDSTEQQEATRQRLTELGKICPSSRMLETLRWQIWWRPGRRIRRRCGTPSRRHNGSSWHRMHGRRLRASVARLGKR